MSDPAPIANAEQAEFWSNLAPWWLDRHFKLEDVAEFPGQLAMDRLGRVAGKRILDIGCGGGRTTLELASRVGPAGTAVGIDIAAPMVDYAREQASRLGVGNAEFVHADAQVHDFGNATFDAAFSRFGVMFFADPVAAFGNVRRWLRPGGELCFVCWQSVFDNEWMLVPGAAATSVTGAARPTTGPGRPGAFSLCDAALIRTTLSAAGFRFVSIDAHNDHVVLSDAQIAEGAVRAMGVGTVRPLLADADDNQRARVREAIEQAFRDRLDRTEVRLARGVHLVTARA